MKSLDPALKSAGGVTVLRIVHGLCSPCVFSEFLFTTFDTRGRCSRRKDWSHSEATKCFL